MPSNTRLDALTIIRNLLAEPYGCPMCDCGTLRRPDAEHWDDCPYLAAQNLLAGSQKKELENKPTDIC